MRFQCSKVNWLSYQFCGIGLYFTENFVIYIKLWMPNLLHSWCCTPRVSFNARTKQLSRTEETGRMHGLTSLQYTSVNFTIVQECYALKLWTWNGPPFTGNSTFFFLSLQTWIAWIVKVRCKWNWIVIRKLSKSSSIRTLRSCCWSILSWSFRQHTIGLASHMSFAAALPTHCFSGDWNLLEDDTGVCSTLYTSAVVPKNSVSFTQLPLRGPTPKLWKMKQ